MTGQNIIDAVIRAKALESAIIDGDDVVFVWSANAAEQIEAALAECQHFKASGKEWVACCPSCGEAHHRSGPDYPSLFADANLFVEAVETAWGIIANASGGNWDKESKDWKEAAERWRDQYVGLMYETRKSLGDESSDQGIDGNHIEGGSNNE